jgi:hypothetical protein
MSPASICWAARAMRVDARVIPLVSNPFFSSHASSDVVRRLAE